MHWTCTLLNWNCLKHWKQLWWTYLKEDASNSELEPEMKTFGQTPTDGNNCCTQESKRFLFSFQNWSIFSLEKTEETSLAKYCEYCKLLLFHKFDRKTNKNFAMTFESICKVKFKYKHAPSRLREISSQFIPGAKSDKKQYTCIC